MTDIDNKDEERHRAKMAKRKAVQDAEVASKTVEKGLLIVNTGPGKGKTTAAFGLALRAVGRGWKVLMIQYTKMGEWPAGEPMGEIAGARRLFLRFAGTAAARFLSNDTF